MGERGRLNAGYSLPSDPYLFEELRELAALGHDHLAALRQRLAQAAEVVLLGAALDDHHDAAVVLAADQAADHLLQVAAACVPSV